MVYDWIIKNGTKYKSVSSIRFILDWENISYSINPIIQCTGLQIIQFQLFQHIHYTSPMSSFFFYISYAITSYERYFCCLWLNIWFCAKCEGWYYRLYVMHTVDICMYLSEQLLNILYTLIVFIWGISSHNDYILQLKVWYLLKREK